MEGQQDYYYLETSPPHLNQDGPKTLQVCTQTYTQILHPMSTSQSVFFWGSEEANSQTNSLYEAADRPNSLQTTLSVDFMVYKLYGLQNLWSVD